MSRPRVGVPGHWLIAFALALLALLLPPALAQGRPGDLDRSFSHGGKVRTRFCGHAHVFSVAIDHRGRIVVAGGDGRRGGFCLARYKPNGRRDRSFGTGGQVSTDFGGHAAARSVAIDSQNRIVAAGGYRPPGDDHLDQFALARYKPNGALDPSFGGDGQVTTDFGGGYGATSVAIGRRGRMVAAGDDGADFTLARYKRNGILDPAFGTGGEVTTDFAGHDKAYTVAIDSRRRVVAGGNNGQNDFALARYARHGDLDDSFSNDGKVTTRFGTGPVRSLAFYSQDRIVAAVGLFSGHFALARYKPNGTLDGSFGGDGEVTTGFDNLGGARSVSIDSRGPRGRIVAAGGNFDLARYKPNGHLDRSFGDRGKVDRDWHALAFAATIDSRDRIVVAGWHGELVLARFIGYGRP